MTVLATYDEDGTCRARSEDPAAIAEALAAVGIAFARRAVAPFAEDAAAEAILDAHAEGVAALCAEGGFAAADVVRLRPDHPDRVALRARFLQEHTHAEDEVRWFVEGAGLFYLHVGDRVLGVRCEAGDVLAVPAGTPHGFDMGPAPRFTAIRLFTDPAGWVAEPTGSDVLARLPPMAAT